MPDSQPNNPFFILAKPNQAPTDDNPSLKLKRSYGTSGWNPKSLKGERVK